MPINSQWISLDILLSCGRSSYCREGSMHWTTPPWVWITLEKESATLKLLIVTHSVSSLVNQCSLMHKTLKLWLCKIASSRLILFLMDCIFKNKILKSDISWFCCGCYILLYFVLAWARCTCFLSTSHFGSKREWLMSKSNFKFLFALMQLIHDVSPFSHSISTCSRLSQFRQIFVPSLQYFAVWL